MVLEFLGNPLKAWIIAALYGAGGFAGGVLCSLIMHIYLKYVAQRTKSSLDNIIISLANKPLQVLLTIVGIGLGFHSLSFPEAVVRWGNHILVLSYILVPAIGLTRISDALIIQYVPLKTIGSLMNKQAELQPVLRKLIKWIVWFIALILGFDTLGYDMSALLAGLGLGGAALALASKDTLANFFGSITVFMDKPFNFNDRIKIAGYDGYIIAMGLRTSRIKTLENRVVIIPNSLFSSSPIENISAEPNSRVSQTLGLKRDGGLAKITQGLEVLKDIGAHVEGTVGSPSAGILSVTGGSCQVSFIYYVKKNADYLETVNRVNCEILRRFEEAGITLL